MCTEPVPLKCGQLASKYILGYTDIFTVQLAAHIDTAPVSIYRITCFLLASRALVYSWWSGLVVQ